MNHDEQLLQRIINDEIIEYPLYVDAENEETVITIAKRYAEEMLKREREQAKSKYKQEANDMVDLCKQLVDRNARIKELEEAVVKLLESPANGCGCPMCDFGILRNPAKDHWDDCEWNNAKKLIEQLKQKL